MRPTSRLTWLAAMAILIPMIAEASPSHEHIISGRLIFDSNYSCDRVEVELNGVENQRVDATSPDFACNFSFSPVGPGTYYIHVNLENFEEVYQRVDIMDAPTASSVGISVNMRTLASKSVNASSSPGDPDPDMIDVSQFLDRYPKKAVSLYKKATNDRHKGKMPAATSELEQAIALAPTFYQAHNDLGLLYRYQGRYDDAETQFLRAHQINENSAEPLINLSSLYIDEQKPDQAVQYSEQAVKANSTSGPAFFNLGVALYKASILDRAEVALKHALDLAPRMGQIRLALANIYLRQHRMDSVMDQLNAYLASEPAQGPERSQAEHLRAQILKAGGQD